MSILADLREKTKNLNSKQGGSRLLPWTVVAICGIVGQFLAPDLLLAQGSEAMRQYGEFPLVGSRVAIWVAAQVHLLFAAFVLGVPMFAVVAEAVGIFGGDSKYDKLAKEFTRLLLVAYSATAIWGAILSFLLVTLYPGLWLYLVEIFQVSMWVYVSLFFLRVLHTLFVLLWMGPVEQRKGQASSLDSRNPTEYLGNCSHVHSKLMAYLYDESSRRCDPRYGTRDGAVLECIRQRYMDAY